MIAARSRATKDTPVTDDRYLEIDHLSKSFGVVEALNGVSFSVRKGEIHAILGENGAGKSTLVKIIRGELAPDAGTLRFQGQEIREYDPLYAHALGIAMVHQELAIFENLTVAENMFPASEFRARFGMIDGKRMYEKARESLALFDLEIDPRDRMVDLSLAEQQVVEILRATSLDKKIIILDEPTSGLKARETEALIERLRRLREQGITILFISHRIPEILRVCDRVTVLRDGEYVETLVNDSLTEEQLITRMVGRELESLYAHKTSYEKIGRTVFLQAKGLSRRKSLHGVDLRLHRGEILGVFGLEGSGVAELSRAIFGLERLDSGELFVKGQMLPRITPELLMRNRVLYLNDNRKQAGLFLNMAAGDNLAAPALRRLSRFGLLSSRAMRLYAERFIDRFRIVIPNTKTKPRNLSGGNQQKLMLSTCLGTEPECLIVNEPTRGIDVGAKAEIHRIIMELSEKGGCVLVFSSELPELISLADRVLVMKDKTLAGEFVGEDITEESIMAAAVGQAA